MNEAPISRRIAALETAGKELNGDGSFAGLTAYAVVKVIIQDLREKAEQIGGRRQERVTFLLGVIEPHAAALAGFHASPAQELRENSAGYASFVALLRKPDAFDVG